MHAADGGEFPDSEPAGLTRDEARMRLVEECADVVQATCNLLATVGVSDLSEHMDRCRERNEARGRSYEEGLNA